ncbi:hypothetical protein ANASTE_00962 [Anaerofustis stercorihominis DSM 17244]|uniref:Uncharacterized protein n=1 Tax=Anaerofustis stercorihominis DSM 17244 TaxID=445971 RepID=B1C8A5_9FIRM|nr:hypothetical protein ANASTE_00962 [Anaerofustis stercorihominis DSM 17244]
MYNYFLSIAEHCRELLYKKCPFYIKGLIISYSIKMKVYS